MRRAVLLIAMTVCLSACTGSSEIVGTNIAAGGGGGSYNSGADVSNSGAANSGHGKVQIQRL